MNFGKNIKKIASNINVGLKFCKVTQGGKPNCTGAALDVFKNKNDSILMEQLNALSLGHVNHKINQFFFFPKTDIIKKSIIEPDQNIKIKVELPLTSTGNEALELPLHIEKEISEPQGQVIIKKAEHMLRIRKKKMKKHKKKKHMRRFKIQIETREIRKNLIEEAELQKEMWNLVENSKNFSAENYVKETLEKYNWVRPVTRVRGMLAPNWVIKKHLKDEEEKKVFRERVKECIKSRE